MLNTRVERLITRLSDQGVQMHGFLLSVGGVQRAAAYYAPFFEGQPHRMFSVSKSMVGLAVGILLDEGKLRLSDRLADHFSDDLPPNPDGRLLRLTLRDALRMATCYERTVYRKGKDDNWARAFFWGAPTHEPGTVFHYDTSASQVLGALVRRCSGLSALDFLDARLFSKIGAKDKKYWLTDPSGECQGGTGLFLSLRDLEKTAHLVLSGGGGLLSKDFLSEMTKKQIDTPPDLTPEGCYGYGYQCWRTRAGYSFYGMGGQLAVCCPEKETLFCTVADTRRDPTGVQKIYDAFFEEIYPLIGKEDMTPARYDLALPEKELLSLDARLTIR